MVVDPYAAIRGALWLVILTAVLLALAVPIYFALQVALAMLGGWS